jgi:hypothetical protein
VIEDKEPSLTGDALSLLNAIRRRGVVTSTLRDAAHEACHALQWDVKRKWTRDNIHAKKPKPHRIFGHTGVHDEIDARAVEQVVCQRLGVDCGPVEKWADICWMEMLKNERISLPMGDWLANQIRTRMSATKVLGLAVRVMEIGAVGE